MRLRQQMPLRVLGNVAHPVPGCAARGYHIPESSPLESKQSRRQATNATVFSAACSLVHRLKSKIPMLPTQPSRSTAFRGTSAGMTQPLRCSSARTLFLLLRGTALSCETSFAAHCTCHRHPTPPIQQICSLSALGHRSFVWRTLKPPSEDHCMVYQHS